MNDYKSGQTYRDDDGSEWKVDDDGYLHLVLANGDVSTFQDEVEEVEREYGPLELVKTPIHVPGVGTFEQPVKNGLVYFPAVPREEDPVNHPTHYTSHPSGVECIQITRHENFNRGNALKYWWRAGTKQYPDKTQTESAIIDYEKAIFYINSEIDRLKEAA